MNTATMHRRLTPHERRTLAVHACVDTRTLEKYLRGVPVRSTCLARIQAALAVLPDLAHLAALREHPDGAL